MNFQEWFCLNHRNSFTVDPKVNADDARFYFGRKEIGDRVKAQLRRAFVEPGVPKMLIYGSYGSGKTQTLFLVEHYLKKNRPEALKHNPKIFHLDLEMGGKSDYLDWHLQLMEALGKATVAGWIDGLFNRVQDREAELREIFQGANHAEAAKNLIAGGALGLRAWRWFCGDKLRPNELEQLKVTRSLGDIGAGDTVSALTGIGRLAERNGEKLIFLMDEGEQFRNVKTGDSVESLHNYLRKLAETSNSTVGFILAAFALTLDEMPDLVSCPMNNLQKYHTYDMLSHLMQRRKLMALGRPIPPLELTELVRRELEVWSRSRTMPAGIVRRARIILLAADGLNNQTIAEKVGLSGAMVGMWRRRFLAEGLAGLSDEPRPGGPRSIPDQQVTDLIRQTLKTKPADGTHWTCRTLAERAGLSKSTVHRVWRAFGIQPHRQKYFKLSTDPYFVEKVRDIVGLYLNPPDKAMVLCVDEKSQIQALDRTQPLLPLGLGYVEGVTHDYVRHGTTTLYAALNIASGQVLTRCTPRHRHQEFLQFLQQIEANVPADFDLHLVVDNYATHKHPKVRRWLAARPRFHVHYTPTYGSWLNQVEIWFNIITQRAIRRGSFRSVKDLVNAITRFVQEYNARATPFVWTATADSILQKVKRLCELIVGTRH